MLTMSTPLYFRVDKAPMPLPKPTGRRGKRVHYHFEKLVIGESVTINRSVSTIRKALTEFRKTPLGVGTRFKTRRITPSLVRVWRTA